MGIVVWTTADLCGIRFSYIPDDERTVLEQWSDGLRRALAGGGV